MDNKECEICSKMTKEKYKHYNLWKTLAIVFICLTALLAVLYFASGIPYNAVSKLLKATAQEHGCDELCVCCYHHLLEDTLGYRVIFPKGYKTVEKIAKEYSNNVVIVRIDGHLTTCRYGICEDIWDCTQNKFLYAHSCL